jgi:hypothetical protein
MTKRPGDPEPYPMTNHQASDIISHILSNVHGKVVAPSCVGVTRIIEGYGSPRSYLQIRYIYDGRKYVYRSESFVAWDYL